jgi:hypothetical protein
MSGVKLTQIAISAAAVALLFQTSTAATDLSEQPFFVLSNGAINFRRIASRQ